MKLKASYVAATLIGIGILFAVLLSMGGCGPHNYKEDQTGGSASTIDNLHRQGKGDENYDETTVYVAPPGDAAPTSQPARLPQSKGIPATLPSNVNPASDTPPPNGVPAWLVNVFPSPGIVFYHNIHHGTNKPDEMTRNRSSTAKAADTKSDSSAGGSSTTGAPTVKMNPLTDDGLGGGGGGGDGGEAQTAWKGVVAEITAASSTAHWMMGLGALILIVGWIICSAYSWLTDKVQITAFAVVTFLGVAIMGTAIILDTHPWIFVCSVLAAFAVLVFYVYHKFSTSAAAAPAASAGTPAATASSAAASVAAPTTLVGDMQADAVKLATELESLFKSSAPVASAASVATPATSTAAK